MTTAATFLGAMLSPTSSPGEGEPRVPPHVFHSSTEIPVSTSVRQKNHPYPSGCPMAWPEICSPLSRLFLFCTHQQTEIRRRRGFEQGSSG